MGILYLRDERLDRQHARQQESELLHRPSISKVCRSPAPQRRIRLRALLLDFAAWTQSTSA
jgi:hypothetical protein